jgi:hypothetical protein
MVYFRELNYLPSSRFCDFVGSSREKEEERRNYSVNKTTFAINTHDKLQRSKKKISSRIYFGWIRRFQGSIRVRIMCKKWAAKNAWTSRN